MSYYRKRPVTIEAIQWNGQNWDELQAFTNNGVRRYEFTAGPPEVTSVYDVLHDTFVTFYVGDWIIKGVKGEFYPCNGTVFLETYEPDHFMDQLYAAMLKPLFMGDATPLLFMGHNWEEPK